jgi:FlaA1/EpsC-like NDP-sugar epimerase
VSVESLAPERGGWVTERLRRDAPLAVLDLGVALGSYMLTLVLRFDGSVPTRYWSSFWRFLPLALAIHLLVNHLYGLYGPMWRYASVHEARRIVLAGVVGGVGVVSASVLVALPVGGLRALPLSVTMFGAVLTLLGAGAVRFQSRLFTTTERLDRGGGDRPDDAEPRRVLIVGAGSAGSMILKDLLRSPSLGLEPVGLIDDDRGKVGRPLHGVRVRGT